MTSLWVNRVYKALRRREPLLQTVHLEMDPEPSKVLSTARLQRPVVDLDSQKALGRLETLHQEPDRRLWFCGSYAGSGIPLLESAAASAVNVAGLIRDGLIGAEGIRADHS